MKFKSHLKKQEVNFCGQKLFLQSHTLRTQERLINERKNISADVVEGDELRKVYFLALRDILVDEHGNTVLTGLDDLAEVEFKELEDLLDQAQKLHAPIEKKD